MFPHQPQELGAGFLYFFDKCMKPEFGGKLLRVKTEYKVPHQMP